MIALAAGGLALLAARVKPEGTSAPTSMAPAFTDTKWGFIEKTTAPDGAERRLLHVVRPPDSDEVTIEIPYEKVRSCRARTEACAPLPYESAAAGEILIALPRTRDPVDTVIELDLVR